MRTRSPGHFDLGDPRIHLARLIERARQLGYIAPTHPRYPRQRVAKRWIAVCEAINANEPVPSHRVEIVTAEDRQRRLAKRLMKREAMRQLAKLSARQTVSLSEAAALSTCSTRALQRAAKAGKLSARKVFIRHTGNVPGRGEFVTTIGAVRQYLASRFIAA